MLHCYAASAAALLLAVANSAAAQTLTFARDDYTSSTGARDRQRRLESRRHCRSRRRERRRCDFHRIPIVMRRKSRSRREDGVSIDQSCYRQKYLTTRPGTAKNDGTILPATQVW